MQTITFGTLSTVWRFGAVRRLSALSLGLSLCLGLGLLALGSAPASAQQCTTDSTDNRGCAVIMAGPSIIEAERQEEERRRASLNMPSAGPRPTAYVAVAMHPDSSDVWVAAMYPSAQAAAGRSMGYCQQAMGAGCEWSWQVEGSQIGVARGANGTIHMAWDYTKAGVQKRLQDACKGYELGCTMMGMYTGTSDFRRGRGMYGITSGENVRFPKDSAALRKRYAALAWISEGPHGGEVWVASGYPSLQASQDTALNLCRAKLTRGQTCGIASSTGNGVIAIFLFATGEQRTMVEQSEARVRQAVAQYCRRQKQKCTIRHIYDARTAGTFAHVYKTGGE